MKYTGEITAIIFRNDSNGYTIARLKIEEKEDNSQISIEEFPSYVDSYESEDDDEDESEITIVGYMPNINKGDKVCISGNYVYHKSYGKQLKLESFEFAKPKTLGDLEKYLGNGLVKGIGPAKAKKIIEKFQEDTVGVLMDEPEKLTVIKGINKEKAKELSDAFKENWGLWEVVSFLSKFGIGSQNASIITKKLGPDAVSIVNDNPYILEELGVRVDFNQIDKMALSSGIEKNSLKRVGAGVIHALGLANNNGHSCVLKSALVQYVTEFLGVSNEDVEDGIKDLKAKKRIITEQREELLTEDGKTEMRKLTWVYPIKYYEAEMNIAERIEMLKNAPQTKQIRDLDKMLEETSDFVLSDKQKEALEMVNNNNVSIITGGPGTGKTTIIKTIIGMYKHLNKKIVLCAPTGRAAKRMTEATGEEARTLHRLLSIGKIESEELDINAEIEPIDADIIIVDEMSMVDLFLMSYLLNGIYRGTKLILVGDSDQLQSVGPGRVLKDLIESNEVPYIILNQIFRQAARSKIIVNAHKVNEGINFIGEVDKKGEETIDDFEFISENSVSNAQRICIDSFNENVQVITPTKRGECGTVTLNKLLQAKYNPKSEYKKEKKFGDIIFREGDNVMQTKNNYDIEWSKPKKENKNDKYDKYGTFNSMQNRIDYDLDFASVNDEHGIGIFNGEMGKIEEINDKDQYMVIVFEDGKRAIYGYDFLDQIVHSYAITIHKSQGSEFDNVVMPIIGVSRMLLTRNVLYTGMTRAKNHLTIISNEPTIEFMINNVNSRQRNSGLCYKLQNI